MAKGWVNIFLDTAMQELNSCKIKIFTKSANLLETKLGLIILMEINSSFQLLLEKYFQINLELTLQENTQVLSGRIKSGTACCKLRKWSAQAFALCLVTLHLMRFKVSTSLPNCTALQDASSLAFLFLSFLFSFLFFKLTSAMHVDCWTN